MIESMACGTPVIVSNTSAMPEVAGEGALQVDPFTPETITKALLKIEADESFRERIVSYGLERAKRYTWRATAQAWKSIYEEIYYL